MRFLSLSCGLLLAAGLGAPLACSTSSSSSTAAADPCDSLSVCCQSVQASAGESACMMQLAAARAAASDGSVCQQLLTGYTADGLCGNEDAGAADGSSSTDGSAHAADAADAGASITAQSAVCSLYLACVAAVEPSQLADSLMAYGPQGTCWSSTATVASQCDTACSQGAASLHMDHGSECPLCATDADCTAAGGSDRCDVTKGECVTCLTDGDCATSDEHCETQTGTCVACNADADCSGNTPHCNGATHACVECLLGSQCSSKTCESDQTCCVPATCPTSYACGSFPDHCGNMLSCGTCAQGFCTSAGEGMSCTTVGTACTPGASPSPCLPGEQCLFDGWHRIYSCAPSEAGKSCTSEGMDTCDIYKNAVGEPVDPYFCYNDGCAQYCLDQGDCVAGKTCTNVLGVPITTAAPAVCL